jgi:hypothetical protein
MTKKRVTVYIDESVWSMGKAAAWESRKSFSGWLEGAIRSSVDVTILDGLRKPKADNYSDKVSEPEMSIADLAKKQAELDEQRKKRKVKKEKIAKVRDKDKIRGGGYFNPQPKKGVK